MISAVKGNLVTLADSAEYMKIFLRETVEITNPDEKKILEAEHVGKLVETLEKLLSETKEITLESMKQVFSDAQKIVGVKGKDFYMPLRIIITGSTKGPELADVLPLLGKEAILKRLLSIDH
jgi:nondiscriminating glutamyl-tRNA synthetase